MLIDFYANGFVHLHTYAPALVHDVAERPEALPIARREAEEGPIVTNGWHRSVALDPAERRVLSLIDGRRSQREVLEACADRSDGEQPVTAERLEGMLHHFAQQALLVA